MIHVASFRAKSAKSQDLGKRAREVRGRSREREERMILIRLFSERSIRFERLLPLSGGGLYDEQVFFACSNDVGGELGRM